jgi:hypothetical protein
MNGSNKKAIQPRYTLDMAWNPNPVLQPVYSEAEILNTMKTTHGGADS